MAVAIGNGNDSRANRTLVVMALGSDIMRHGSSSDIMRHGNDIDIMRHGSGSDSRQ